MQNRYTSSFSRSVILAIVMSSAICFADSVLGEEKGFLSFNKLPAYGEFRSKSSDWQDLSKVKIYSKKKKGKKKSLEEVPSDQANPVVADVPAIGGGEEDLVVEGLIAEGEKNVVEDPQLVTGVAGGVEANQVPPVTKEEDTTEKAPEVGSSGSGGDALQVGNEGVVAGGSQEQPVEPVKKLFSGTVEIETSPTAPSSEDYTTLAGFQYCSSGGVDYRLSGNYEWKGVHSKSRRNDAFSEEPGASETSSDVGETPREEETLLLSLVGRTAVEEGQGALEGESRVYDLEHGLAFCQKGAWASEEERAKESESNKSRWRRRNADPTGIVIGGATSLGNVGGASFKDLKADKEGAAVYSDKDVVFQSLPEGLIFEENESKERGGAVSATDITVRRCQGITLKNCQIAKNSVIEEGGNEVLSNNFSLEDLGAGGGVFCARGTDLEGQEDSSVPRKGSIVFESNTKKIDIVRNFSVKNGGALSSASCVEFRNNGCDITISDNAAQKGGAIATKGNVVFAGNRGEVSFSRNYAECGAAGDTGKAIGGGGAIAADGLISFSGSRKGILFSGNKAGFERGVLPTEEEPQDGEVVEGGEVSEEDNGTLLLPTDQNDKPSTEQESTIPSFDEESHTEEEFPQEPLTEDKDEIVSVGDEGLESVENAPTIDNTASLEQDTLNPVLEEMGGADHFGEDQKVLPPEELADSSIESTPIKPLSASSYIKSLHTKLRKAFFMQVEEEQQDSSTAGQDHEGEVSQDAELEGESSLTHGGAIYSKRGVVTQYSGEVAFSGNEATGSGGAIYCERDVETISQEENNKAILFASNETVTFSDNHSKRGAGGAICLHRKGGTGGSEKAVSAEFFANKKVSFSDNSAKGNGGAICTDSRDRVELFEEEKTAPASESESLSINFFNNKEIEFKSNSAEERGGALFAEKVLIAARPAFAKWLATRSVEFSGNKASKSGGAIYLSHRGPLREEFLSGNSQQDSSPGDKGSLTITEVLDVVIFSNNSSSEKCLQPQKGVDSYKGGGGIWAKDVEVSFNGEVTFTGNKAKVEVEEATAVEDFGGGAIYSLGTTTLKYNRVVECSDNAAVLELLSTSQEKEGVKQEGSSQVFSKEARKLRFKAETAFPIKEEDVLGSEEVIREQREEKISIKAPDEGLSEMEDGAFLTEETVSDFITLPSIESSAEVVHGIEEMVGDSTDDTSKEESDFITLPSIESSAEVVHGNEEMVGGSTDDTSKEEEELPAMDQENTSLQEPFSEDKDISEQYVEEAPSEDSNGGDSSSTIDSEVPQDSLLQNEDSLDVSESDGVTDEVVIGNANSVSGQLESSSDESGIENGDLSQPSETVDVTGEEGDVEVSESEELAVSEEGNNQQQPEGENISEDAPLQENLAEEGNAALEEEEAEEPEASLIGRLIGGGAIRTDVLEMVSNESGVIFENNTAKCVDCPSLSGGESLQNIGGGAVLSSKKVLLKGNGKVLFSENKAEGRRSKGGAIYSNVVDISDNGLVSFSGNTAEQCGGAIYVQNDPLPIATAEGLESCSEEGAGSLPIRLSQNIFVDFLRNSAGEKGGAICVNRGGLVLEKNSQGLSFLNNRVGQELVAGRAVEKYSIYAGGAIYSEGSTTLAENGGIIFSGNQACDQVARSWGARKNLINGQGGAICSSGITITGNKSVIFSDNIANGEGGAIHVKAASVNPKEFSDEEVVALISQNSEVTFSGNKAARSGGAINVEKGSLELSNNRGSITFLDNAVLGANITELIASGPSQEFVDDVEDSRSVKEQVSDLVQSLFGPLSASREGSGKASGGGAIAASKVVEISGNKKSTIFSGNSAQSFGGAIFVGTMKKDVNNSVRVFDREPKSCLRNTLKIYSGDVSLEENFDALNIPEGNEKETSLDELQNHLSSSLLITGNRGAVVFEGNCVTSKAAPVTFSEDLGRYHSKEACFTQFGGGAVHANNLMIEKSGDVLFLNNTAPTGGAIRITEDGTLSLSADYGNILFKGNRRNCEDETPDAIFMSGNRSRIAQLRAKSGRSIKFCDPIIFENPYEFRDNDALVYGCIKNRSAIISDYSLQMNAQGDGGEAYTGIIEFAGGVNKIPQKVHLVSGGLVVSSGELWLECFEQADNSFVQLSANTIFGQLRRPELEQPQQTVIQEVQEQKEDVIAAIEEAPIFEPTVEKEPEGLSVLDVKGPYIIPDIWRLSSSVNGRDDVYGNGCEKAEEILREDVEQERLAGTKVSSNTDDATQPGLEELLPEISELSVDTGFNLKTVKVDIGSFEVGAEGPKLVLVRPILRDATPQSTLNIELVDSSGVAMHNHELFSNDNQISFINFVEHKGGDEFAPVDPKTMGVDSVVFSLGDEMNLATGHQGVWGNLQTGADGRVTVQWRSTGYKPSAKREGHIVANTMWSQYADIHGLKSQIFSHHITDQRMNIECVTNVWGSGLGQFVDSETINGIDGFTHKSGGYALGMDTEFSEGFLIGGSLAQTFGHTDSRLNKLRVTQKGYVGSIYGALNHFGFCSGWLLKGAVSYGSLGNDMITKDEKGSTKGSWVDSSLLASVRLDHIRCHNRPTKTSLLHLTFSPFVEVEYAFVKQRPFIEIGLDATGVKEIRDFDKGKLQNISIPMGFSIENQYSGKCRSEVNTFSIAYSPDVYRRNPQATLYMPLAAPDVSWVAEGCEWARHAIKCRFDNNTEWVSGFGTYFSFEMDGRRRAFSYHINGGARVIF